MNAATVFDKKLNNKGGNTIVRAQLRQLINLGARAMASNPQTETVDGERNKVLLHDGKGATFAGRNARLSDGGKASNAFLGTLMARIRVGEDWKGRLGGFQGVSKPLHERFIRGSASCASFAETGKGPSRPEPAGEHRLGALEGSVLGNERLQAAGASVRPLRVSDDASVKRTERHWHVVSVGGGPRASTQVSAEIDFMLRHKEDFERIMKLGGQYDVRTTVIEQQSRDRLGQGRAWTKENQGTVNTGAEDGYKSRLSELYRDQRKGIEAALADKPVAAAMFAKAYSDSSDGNPLTHRGATTRALLGKEENEHLEELVSLTQTDPLLKEIYHLDLLTETKAAGIDLAHPQTPSVLVQDRDGNERVIEADTVRLNTGTTTASPLKASQAGVAEHAYIGPMYADGLRKTLEEKGLLDDAGKLKAGTSVLTGGSGLSLYDQLLSLDSFMNLTVQDPSSPVGYRITEEAKEKYQGAILATSRTVGKWIPPRHSHTPEWTQATEPMAGAKEQHALFLHNQGEEVFKSWEDIMVGSIAAATGRTPKQVRGEGLETANLIKLQHQETEAHAAAPKDDPHKASQTLFGAKRQASLGSILGFGMERDVGRMLEEMDEAAPLTYRGRGGYLIHRAQIKAITEPGTPVGEDNEKLMNVYRDRMMDVTASPYQVHDLVHQLMEAGILKYTQGSYGQIAATGAEKDADKPLSFTDDAGNVTKHDLFLVSPTFQRSRNPAEASLKDQVDSAGERAKGSWQVGPHRRVWTNRKELSHLEDNGLTGKGMAVLNEAGRRTTIGAFAVDVNNRESAVQLAPGLAYRRFSQQHLAAAGERNPAEVVDALYEECLPTDVEYREEAEKFRDVYHETMERAAFLKVIEGVENDDPNHYEELYAKGRTAEGRELAGGAAYLREKARIPPFSPANMREYFGRFVDAPEHIHQRVYMRALDLATHRLASEQAQSQVGMQSDHG
ncbi:MAG: hypothetical protein OXU70_12690 [Gammaproteobacteria bacterium]|nr:hypothetical protein [Gammaproteobacteria bacterium]